MYWTHKVNVAPTHSRSDTFAPWGVNKETGVLNCWCPWNASVGRCQAKTFPSLFLCICSMIWAKVWRFGRSSHQLCSISCWHMQAVSGHVWSLRVSYNVSLPFINYFPFIFFPSWYSLLSAIAFWLCIRLHDSYSLAMLDASSYNQAF